MRFRWRVRLSLPGRSLSRWLVTAGGLVVLAVALAGAAGPYQQTREFRAVSACSHCFDTEQGSIAAKRTYTTTSTHTDSDGQLRTTTTTHHELTWQRADGSRHTRDVPASFYTKAEEGRPATFHLWRTEVVGVQVPDATTWFLPQAGSTLRWWLLLASLGVGVLLWGLLFGWWDGVFMLAFRTFCWLFLSFLPTSLTAQVLAYGWGTGLVVEIVFAAVFASIAGWMLAGSLQGW